MVFVLLSVGLLDVIALSPHSRRLHLWRAEGIGLCGDGPHHADGHQSCLRAGAVRSDLRGLHLANASAGRGSVAGGRVFDMTGSYTTPRDRRDRAGRAIGAVWMPNRLVWAEERAEP